MFIVAFLYAPRGSPSEFSEADSPVTVLFFNLGVGGGSMLAVQRVSGAAVAFVSAVALCVACF